MRDFDLCIIGSGSGNSIPDERFAGSTIALVDKGTFGGTCLNVGCIPTKMLVYPADLATSPDHARRLGVDLSNDGIHWPAIRDRVFGRIDPISAGGEQWRAGNENVTLYRHAAHFVGPKTLQVGDETIRAEQFVIAAGSRAMIPDIAGIDQVAVHTSDTVMRLDELPKSMIIIGGGFIAAEFAHVFSAYGTEVTVVARSATMLRQQDHDVAARFTELLARRVDLRTDSMIIELVPDGTGVRALISTGTEQTWVRADILLVATGRIPNGDTLSLATTGVEVDTEGFIIVDDHQQTTAAGIFALGDVSNPSMLKHVANHEARVVQHNVLSGLSGADSSTMINSDHRYVPSAVFSDPQVASVGLTEAQAKDAGLDYVVKLQEYGATAYGWAMEDQDHFVKLVADRQTNLLLGAHLIGPQASSLIQPLIQGMNFGQTAHELARGQYWIHPAMAEVVENALLGLPRG